MKYSLLLAFIFLCSQVAEGRVIFKGNFSHNQKVGEWTRFFANGEQMKLYYKKGILINKQLGSVQQLGN